jgi:hypothetical protein
LVGEDFQHRSLAGLDTRPHEIHSMGSASKKLSTMQSD